MIDFENFKINCSQIGSLMGNARDNKPPTAVEVRKLFGILGRDYGEMTEAMKFNAREILRKGIDYEPSKPSDKILSELILIYAYETYGKGKVNKGNDSPHAAEKGTMAESGAIQFISKIDGIEYSKNEELFSNKWFKGVPDIIVRTEKNKAVKIIEVKVSYDLPSFIMSQRKPEKAANNYEIMGYMDMLGCKTGEIIHVLVDMPNQMVSFEEKRLRERYKDLELDDMVISERIERTLNNMEYSSIPDDLKIFRRTITINKYTMKAVKSRATIAKKWLKDIHEMFTKNLVNLSETEPYQEDSI